jgi:ribonuclease HI
VVLFGEEKDWKEFLFEDTQVEIADLLERAKKHRCAYSKADDVKVAQLWCALAEVLKQIKEMDARLEKMETAIKALVGMGEIAKRELLTEKLRDVFKPKSAEEKEQVDQIVETLMEF